MVQRFSNLMAGGTAYKENKKQQRSEITALLNL